MNALRREVIICRKPLAFLYPALFVLASCSVSKKITQQADKFLLKDPVIATGHIGICIYDPEKNTYLYNHNATKYFVPASNVKLFTLYAGMKYLGDSLAGLRYIEQDSVLLIEGTGDPSTLHPDFLQQPVVDFLKRSNKPVELCVHPWKFKPLGKGWAWDDYNDHYMAERSELPLYGNVVRINYTGGTLKVFPNEYNIILYPLADSLHDKFRLQREKNSNFINIYPAKEPFKEAVIPLTNVETSQLTILKYSLDKPVEQSSLLYLPANARTIRSRPADSLFKPMMQNSDNFFAEQTLLMASREHLGYMSDEMMIDSLLHTDLKDIPQLPRWVDGSGLSRYNLFTPQSFIYILNKMKADFGLERLKKILPTGGEGTLKNYFNEDSSYIYAKTGSLNNQSSISGFLLTNKNKWLIFSILVNNFQGNSSAVKQSVQSFIEEIRTNF